MLRWVNWPGITLRAAEDAGTKPAELAGIDADEAKTDKKNELGP